MPRVQCPESVESLQNFPKVLKDIGEAPIDNRGNEVAGDSGNQSAWIYEAGDLSPSPRPAFKCRVSGIITSQFVAIAPRVVVTLVSARLRNRSKLRSLSAACEFVRNFRDLSVLLGSVPTLSLRLGVRSSSNSRGVRSSSNSRGERHAPCVRKAKYCDLRLAVLFLFTMRDDIEFNIKFCEEVEQYSCLYDNSR
ncbi:hypothetical protein J6590_068787 [Homalodisca vitripennis]|nr:hypothetical protein J6590_068787 [Homalodisca vitripennis]